MRNLGALVMYRSCAVLASGAGVDALQADAYTKVAQACVPPPERAATAGAAARKSGPVLHPVLLLTRWDTTNAFHSLEVGAAGGDL